MCVAAGFTNFRMFNIPLVFRNKCRRAHGVVVSHPLSMREALGSIPSVSIWVFFFRPHEQSIRRNVSVTIGPPCQ